MARIGMNARMELRPEQRMLLQPRMLQSIEVLQLPAFELESWLLDAAEKNEAVRLEPISPGRRGTRADTDAHDEMLRNQPDRGKSLAETIAAELATADLEPELEEWVHFLVGCIDDRGFLSAEDHELLELAESAGLEGGEGALGAALGALQRLEPRGLGARNAIEALLLQLDPDDPDYAYLCRMLEEFVEELARNKLPSVARAMGVEIDHLLRLIETLRELNPRPAADLVERSAPVITPEVIVEWTGQGYEVRVPKAALPAVSVDPDVEGIAKDRSQDKEVRSYLRKRIEQARWIVEAVEQRGRTLLRVARAVFAHQREFLDKGPGHLVPLRMNEVAKWLDIHTSTVSRAVSGKYAQTPWGIFPLREFFQAGTGVDEGTARDEVREIVREIIEGEDKAKPLADDEVVGELAGRGIEIARRTVAKYRKELGIPSSYRRRAYG